MKNEWLLPVLEEYKRISYESLDSIKGQQSTLRIGTATVGILLAVGFDSWENSLLTELLFLTFIPFICYLVLVIWIGEVARMMRAGYYISMIEQKVNTCFTNKENLIFWENWIRTKDAKGRIPQMKYKYLAIIALFFSSALMSIIIGNIKIGNNHFSNVWWYINLGEVLFFISTLFYIYKTGKRFEKL